MGGRQLGATHDHRATEELIFAANDEVGFQGLSGTLTMLTPPSCAPGTNTATPLFTATARNGDNRVGGVWEYALGGQLGQYAWGGGTGVPFDTGSVPIDMTVDLAGSGAVGTLSIGTGLPLSLNGNAYTQITGVGLRAEVTRLYTNPNVTLTADWEGIDITFFDDAGNGYQYPGMATQICQMPLRAQTPPPPSSGTTFLSRIISPGSVSGATYPVRLTLNGSFRLYASVPPNQLSSNQIVVKVFIWAN
jgi:hypothetical protein